MLFFSDIVQSADILFECIMESQRHHFCQRHISRLVSFRHVHQSKWHNRRSPLKQWSTSHLAQRKCRCSDRHRCKFVFARECLRHRRWCDLRRQWLSIQSHRAVEFDESHIVVVHPCRSTMSRSVRRWWWCLLFSSVLSSSSEIFLALSIDTTDRCCWNEVCRIDIIDVESATWDLCHQQQWSLCCRQTQYSHSEVSVWGPRWNGTVRIRQ